jgi:EpsI family protein
MPAEWRADDYGTAGVLGSAIQSYARPQDHARVTLQIAAYSPSSRPNSPPDDATSTEREEWHRPNWREIASRDFNAAIEGGSLVLRETVWQGQSGRTLAWSWYSHRGEQTASPLLARWRLALDRLAGGSGTGERITVSTSIGALAPSESAGADETNSGDAQARLVLREFTRSTAAAIGKGLNHVDQH